MSLTQEQQNIDAAFKGIAVDMKQLPNKSILERGAVGNGITVENDAFSAAFQADFEKTLFVPKATYKLTQGLTINVAALKLLGDRALLDFSGLTSGVALTIVGAGSGNPWDNCTNLLQSLRIKGPGMGTNTKGIVFDTPTEGGSSHYSVDQVAISGFGINVELRNNAYIQNFSRFSSYNAGVALYAPGGVTNAGERISFVQCSFFNSTLAIKGENPDADLFFSQCSLDYNTKHIESHNVLMEFHGCHIEGKNYTAPVITADGYGANLKFFGGRILNTANTSKPGAIVQCDNNATMRFYSPDLVNLGTTGRNFATGNSRRNVKIYNPVGYEVPGVPLHTSDADNQFLDGTFVQNSIVDNWTVNGTGTRVSPTLLQSGDGNPEVSVTMSTAKVQGSNAHSLKLTKRWGSSSAASLYVSVPIDRKKPLSAYFSLLPAAGVTGTVFISFQLAGGMYYDANGLPSFRKAVEVAQFAVDLANVSDWFTQDMFNRWYQPDGWADNLIISINAVLMSQGDLYIGTAQISSF